MIYSWRMTSLPRRHIRASHFRQPKSRLGPSESLRAKSDATARLGIAISTDPPRFATIRDRRRVDRRVTDRHVDGWTCGQVDMWTDGSGRSRAFSYYSIGFPLPFCGLVGKVSAVHVNVRQQMYVVYVLYQNNHNCSHSVGWSVVSHLCPTISYGLDAPRLCVSSHSDIISVWLALNAPVRWLVSVFYRGRLFSF